LKEWSSLIDQGKYDHLGWNWRAYHPFIWRLEYHFFRSFGT